MWMLSACGVYRSCGVMMDVFEAGTRWYEW